MGMLGGWVVLLGGLPTGKPVERRFLAGDSVPTAGLRGSEEGIVGVIDGLLGRLALALAAAFLAVPASLRGVDGA